MRYQFIQVTTMLLAARKDDAKDFMLYTQRPDDHMSASISSNRSVDDLDPKSHSVRPSHNMMPFQKVGTPYLRLLIYDKSL